MLTAKSHWCVEGTCVGAMAEDTSLRMHACYAEENVKMIIIEEKK